MTCCMRATFIGRLTQHGYHRRQALAKVRVDCMAQRGYLLVPAIDISFSQVMLRLVSIALLMVSLSTTADAQPIVYGLGISSCSYWTDNRQKSRHASELSQISWVQG